MWIFIRLKNFFTHYFFNLNGLVITFILATYFLINWVLLFLCQEKNLILFENYLYWMIVTASTVGYGDLSPETTAGKYVVAFFTIPFGLSLFALIIGRVAVFSATQWKKGIKGLRRLNIENHIVVIGWNQKRTLHLLNLLITETRQDQQRNILLCTTEDIENPLPEHINFIKVSKFNDQEEMQRACINKASAIIIDTKLDDVTLTTALFCSSLNPDAHLIVYFSDESLSELLKKHCPQAECTPSLSVEILVKAAMDPGSSLLHHELLNAGKGVTQYSVQYPDNAESIKMSFFFSQFKQAYDATIIAVMKNDPQDMIINPALQMEVSPGMTIYYIAKKRINNVDWQAFYV